MKRRKFLKCLTALLPFAVLAGVLAAVLFFPAAEKKDEKTQVVRIWNVDTFEGGKGSRTAFLRRAARKAEDGQTGVYYLVTSYTAEGAEAACARGERPDILSFGIGLSAFTEEGIPLPYSFAGGALGGSTYAYPWCRGEYALFSLTDDFEEEGRTAVSAGGENLAEVAALLGGIEGEIAESSAAYTGFLSGKYRYLLGTQRDVCRFRTRGVQVYRRDLPAYNDLYQYLSVLSEEKREICLGFLEVLLSDEVQKSLSDIGMLPVGGEKGTRTVSVFTDGPALDTIRRTAEGRDEKNLDNFLKTI